MNIIYNDIRLVILIKLLSFRSIFSLHKNLSGMISRISWVDIPDFSGFFSETTHSVAKNV